MSSEVSSRLEISVLTLENYFGYAMLVAASWGSAGQHSTQVAYTLCYRGVELRNGGPGSNTTPPSLEEEDSEEAGSGNSENYGSF